jgi:DNA-binding beta-propeller fold protein YncE
MQRRIVLSVAAAALMLLPALASAQGPGPYRILGITKVGGEGGFDYVDADSENRKLYVARSGANGHIAVYDLDTLKQVGDITGVSAHGAQVEDGHGFGSSKQIAMWDAKTLAPIKKIEVTGNPDGMLAADGHLFVLSHSAPNVTVIDAKDGAVQGTIDLGGAPEEAVSDGKGHLYIDLEDKGAIAVVDIKAMKQTGTYDIKAQADGCAGLAIDRRNGILFATCRQPAKMVIVRASDGKILSSLPIGSGTDGAAFNPQTMEAFSSNGDGTLTIVKEVSPTSFAIEQTLTTAPRAKTLALDEKTGHILLITAQFEAPATPGTPPAPGQRPARPRMVPDSFEIITVGR